MKTGLPIILEQIQQAGAGLTDGQLVARFVAARDEASFAALLHRHGPMVFGVCRRVLRDAHDAEDAFQATFLVLARKAASVVKRESVGSYLYGVAYRTALEAAAANARRRARERRVRDMARPKVAAAGATADAPDWRPLLDRELGRLSEKYRAAVVLCDLEGRSRKEAARLLGVPVGTLSSRLTEAHKLLAKRLAGRGLVLSMAALTASLAADAAAAQIPAALAGVTTKAAVLVAVGQLPASTAAVLLMKGVMKAMLMKKLRLAVGAFMVVAALGAVGVTCRPGDEARAQDFGQPAARAAGKPQSELEALRKENELLKINNNVLLEKVGSLQAELRAARPRDTKVLHGVTETLFNQFSVVDSAEIAALDTGNTINVPAQATKPSSGAVKEIEAALKRLRETSNNEGERRAVDELEKALKKLRERLKETTPPGM